MVKTAFPRAVKARREPDAPVKTYMRYYIPFAGVKYYRLLTDIDLALGGALRHPWSNLMPDDIASGLPSHLPSISYV